MKLRDTLETLLDGRSLSESRARDLLHELAGGDVPSALAGALLAALRAKGESADELRGFAMGMRELARVPGIDVTGAIQRGYGFEIIVDARLAGRQTAFVDGFIDVNGDGDWDDSGEKVLDSVEVTEGTDNRFPIPSMLGSSVFGRTSARFRSRVEAARSCSG